MEQHTRRDALRAAAIATAAGVAIAACDSEREPGGARRGYVLRGVTAVGSDGQVEAPAEHEVVDLRGAVVLPGLCDMHVHLTNMDTVFPVLHIVNGVTTIRVMAGEPFQHEWRRRTDRGELLGPRLVIGSPILDGKPSQWRGTGEGLPVREVGDAAEARAAVTEHRGGGADFLKVYSQMARPTFEALCAEAARQAIPVLGHCPDEVPARPHTTSDRPTCQRPARSPGGRGSTHSSPCADPRKPASAASCSAIGWSWSVRCTRPASRSSPAPTTPFPAWSPGSRSTTN
ncbi:amidohydrolase family protein [Amycolatopsis suaedae]|uniref:Amidohydrolase-related domain-containing protein n=1 Tax=Amycolatopsis suaedae TaxID=2510978 RepID=A0A4Q7JBZ8_9PSEU|nr:hypothetical protein [Amycolatopsis suaedae]RZQ64556.1 hypothetical protein EWH70_06495 [Amycolatopsis suaedae]